MAFPYLQSVSKKTGVTPEQMRQIYELEHDFYQKIGQESSFEERQKLYEHVYVAVAQFFDTDQAAYFEKLVAVKKKIAFQFKKELAGKSVLDVGCGNGSFLYALAQTDIPTQDLYGLDIKAPLFPNDEAGRRIKCYQRNIIRFEVPQQFDILILDNVYEHIAPQDKGFFLESLRKSLKPNGKIIMIIPHRFFGPTDFTSIIDNTMTGKLTAHCVHLNETTYGDMVQDLASIGLSNCYTTVPFITLSPLRNWLPGLRLPVSWFVALEKSPFLMKILRSVLLKGRCLFRMEVIIIAQKLPART